MKILSARSEPPGPVDAPPESARAQQPSGPTTVPVRSREEVDINAGMLLLVLLVILLLALPALIVASVRFRIARRRAEAIHGPEKLLNSIEGVRHPRDPSVTDPWQESGRRVRIDSPDDGND